MEPNYDYMNPGIRKTVKLLRSLGYYTTDSGDGATRDFKCDQERPYVIIRVEPEELVVRSKMLHHDMQMRGINLEPMDSENTVPTLEASYSPLHGMAILTLWNVKDSMLP